MLLLPSTALLALLALPVASQRADEPRDPLVGKPAPAWHAERWINSAPLALSDLRGRVILLRFWTAPDCPFCSATAPALNEFHARYAARGLQVIGFYHHKQRSPLDAAAVEHYTRTFGFRFPIAIDRDWRSLRDYWLDAPSPTPARKFTSASFLIDRRGIIRHIHPGGQYVRGDADYTRMVEHIEQLCAERP